MPLLPTGTTIELAKHNKSGKLLYYVTFPREYIIRQVLNMLKKRITQAEISLTYCNHTKRKHRLKKLITAMKAVKERYNNELIELESSD